MNEQPAKHRNLDEVKPQVILWHERVRAHIAKAKERMPQILADQIRFRTSEEWESRGVPVQWNNKILSRNRRANNIVSPKADSDAIVSTCNRGWMRSLEKQGIRPQSIETYENGVEIRLYVVPKTWMRAPHKPKKEA